MSAAQTFVQALTGAGIRGFNGLAPLLAHAPGCVAAGPMLVAGRAPA